MTSLQHHCILGLAEIKTLHPRDKIMSKNAGWAGNKITEFLTLKLKLFGLIGRGGGVLSDFCENLTEFYQISLKYLVYLTDFSP